MKTLHGTHTDPMSTINSNGRKYCNIIIFNGEARTGCGGEKPLNWPVLRRAARLS